MFEQLQFHEATLLKMWNQPLVRKNEINISNYKEFHINLFKVKRGYSLKKCQPPFNFFFWNIFKKFKAFFVGQNNLCEPFSFYKGFFHKNPGN